MECKYGTSVYEEKAAWGGRKRLQWLSASSKSPGSQESFLIHPLLQGKTGFCPNLHEEASPGIFHEG